MPWCNDRQGHGEPKQHTTLGCTDSLQSKVSCVHAQFSVTVSRAPGWGTAHVTSPRTAQHVHGKRAAMLPCVVCFHAPPSTKMSRPHTRPERRGRLHLPRRAEAVLTCHLGAPAPPREAHERSSAARSAGRFEFGAGGGGPTGGVGCGWHGRRGVGWRGQRSRAPRPPARG